MPAPIPSRRGWLLTAATLTVAGQRLIAHDLDTAWPAERIVRAQISGVAVDAKGRVLVLNRGENHWMPQGAFKRQKIKQPAVLVIDAATGRTVSSWGENTFIMPHQIVARPDGHAWVVDVGLHQAIEFDADGKKLRTIGGPKVRFNMPTDLAFLSDGSFIVSDGYVNSRVVKFSPEGRAIATWGTKGARPLQFNVPHSVAVDDRDRIYVADRENDRIQILSAEGEFLGEWTDVDTPVTVRFAGGSLFVLSNLDADKGIVRRLDLQGRVLDTFHTKPAGTTEDFEWPHGMAVADGGRDVYVGFTLTGRKVQRYRRGDSGAAPADRLPPQ